MKKLKAFIRTNLNKITAYLKQKKFIVETIKVFSKIKFYISVPIRFINRLFNLLSHRNRKIIIGYIFISPWLIGLYLFGIKPLSSSIRMSLANSAAYVYNTQLKDVEFIIKGIGFGQYQSIFKNNPLHVDLLVGFIKDIALVVPLVMVFSVILALMLNQKIAGRGIFRVIFFIPVILLSGSMLKNFGDYGLLTVPAVANGNIESAINFYLPHMFATIIIGTFNKVVLFLWLSGVQTIIFLAGLQKIDRQIYEAAAIDGASLWEKFWKITLPTLIPLMFINIIYTTIVYSNLSTNPVIGLINRTMVDIKYGRAYSSALSWVLFLIELATILVYGAVIKIASRRYN